MEFERLSVLERSKNYCVLSIKNEPKVSSYRIRASSTLDNAFAGTSDIIVPPLQKGHHFISTGLRRKRRFYTSDNTRGQTRMVFDFDEFQGVSFPNTPSDDQFSYLTVQRELITTGAFTTDTTRVYVVPNSGFNNMQTPSATIAGLAPIVASTLNGALPLTGSLEIILPRFLGSFTLRNLDGTNSVFYSFGFNMPMAELPADGTLNLTGTQSDTIVLASLAGPATFNIVGGIENASI